MTHSSTADASFGAAHAEHIDEKAQRRRCGGMAKRRWSVVEIAVVVGSFIVFWPLGIAALILKLTKGELWRGASETPPPWTKWKKPEGFDGLRAWKSDWHHASTSGNAAFDDYRRVQLEKLEAERRKLDDERKAFAEHLTKLRRAKDQDEFDRFMSERSAPAAPQA